MTSSTSTSTSTTEFVVVGWEYRHRETHPQTVNYGQWSEWQRVTPRNPHISTVEDAVREFQEYIAQGYSYELRTLYTGPLVVVPSHIRMSMSMTTPAPEALCEDEGCPQHGTTSTHICIEKPKPQPELALASALCRQRLMHEGKPYPRSSCAVCGSLSPRHRECNAVIAAEATYTTGHCERHRQPGGCDLHNLQCGWPACDRQDKSETQG